MPNTFIDVVPPQGAGETVTYDDLLKVINGDRRITPSGYEAVPERGSHKRQPPAAGNVMAQLAQELQNLHETIREGLASADQNVQALQAVVGLLQARAASSEAKVRDMDAKMRDMDAAHAQIGGRLQDLETKARMASTELASVRAFIDNVQVVPQQQQPPPPAPQWCAPQQQPSQPPQPQWPYARTAC